MRERSCISELKKALNDRRDLARTDQEQKPNGEEDESQNHANGIAQSRGKILERKRVADLPFPLLVDVHDGYADAVIKPPKDEIHAFAMPCPTEKKGDDNGAVGDDQWMLPQKIHV